MIALLLCLQPVNRPFPIENKDIFSQFPTKNSQTNRFVIPLVWPKSNINLFKTNKNRDVYLQITTKIHIKVNKYKILNKTPNILHCSVNFFKSQF